MKQSHIIPFFPGLQQTSAPDVSLLTTAAWTFARTILWPNRDFSTYEHEAARAHIQTYFDLSKNPAKAFVVFCERIIITKRFITGEPASRYVPDPSIWFNRHYEHGFAGTRNWYNQIAAKRQSVPGYMQHFTVLAENFLLYAQKPSVKLFKATRKALLDQNAPGLLQYFYNVTIHLNYHI